MSRLISLVATVIILLLIVGAVLYIVEANDKTGIGGFFGDLGRFFADPFRHIFNLKDNKLQLAINYAIAGVVYAVIAAVLVKLVSFLGGRIGGRRRAADTEPVE